MDQPRRKYLRFALLSGLAFLLVAALVWTIVLRERATRRLYLEYEAYRASASLLDAFRENPGLAPADDRVLGFGIYDSDGSALARSGTAPSFLKPREVEGERGLRQSGDSFVLARSLGPGAPGMPGMGRMQGGPGMGRSHGMGPLQEPPPAEPRVQGSMPRALWIEFRLGGFGRDRAVLYGSGVAASAALAGLYVAFLMLYRRNAKLAEGELRNRELVQLGEAARTLVHEIKNPLGIIRIQAASLRRLEPGTAVAKAAEKGAAIDEEVERLAGLADRIREFLRGGEGEPRDLDLEPWLLDFAARYAGGEAGPELELGDAEEGAKARIDPERLSLALDNLVMNAREAAAAGPLPRVSLAARGRHWEISVADRGPGVGPEDAERLFEPFFTTKAKGSGIGLALARRVVRAAGGEVEYRPRPGGGSVFSILLPMRK